MQVAVPIVVATTTAKPVVAVTLGGAACVALLFPRTFPQFVVFVLLGSIACLTSAWKVNLPIPVTNGSTLSVSYAANLMSLLLLGPGHAVLIAVAAGSDLERRVRRDDGGVARRAEPGAGRRLPGSRRGHPGLRA